MRKEEVRAHSFTHTHTKRSGFLNTYKTLAYAVTYMKMLSIAQNYVEHGQQKVCGIQFEILLMILLLEKPSSPSTKPPTTHPFLLAIIYSLCIKRLITHITNIRALSAVYALMYYQTALSTECLITKFTKKLTPIPPYIRGISAFITAYMKFFIQSTLLKKFKHLDIF